MSTTSSPRRKLLFLNPPAPVPVIRDYYCSKTSRSNYLFQPIDFVMQSGILGEDFQLFFLDAIRDRLSDAATALQVADLNPDIIFFLAGAINYPADLEFMATLARPGRVLIGSGDIFLAAPGDWLRQYPFLDAVALDFTNPDIRNYLRGDYQSIKRMAYRADTGEIREILTKSAPAPINVGLPHHTLFLADAYRFPFAKQQRFSVFLTDFGCPFHCRFCVMPSLPYGYRENTEALTELHSLHALGIYELFWMNQTFGIRKEATLELLAAMQNFAPRFSWTAFCRPDLLLDERLVTAMAQSGCHTIIIGVENGSEEILRQYRKEYSLPQIAEALAICRKHQIRTVGTFILGLPGETIATIRATSRLARTIGCDFASFHVAVPRAATQLRQEAITAGKIATDDFAMDQAGSYITLCPDGIDQATLLALRREAVRKFYLRPGFLLRQLLQKRSWAELSNMLYQGFFLFFGESINLRKKNTLGKPPASHPSAGT
ncbi:MAG: radical SAM protein [Desulfobulbaceae bacterium]|nr:radical SAM protein [Desulfobulbaceae bacterium]